MQCKFLKKWAIQQAFLQLQHQQNFQNLELRREILELVSEKSFHFEWGNLKFPLSLEEKSCFLAKKKPLSLENFLSLDCLEFSENRRKKPL